MTSNTISGRDFVIVGIQSIDDEVGNIKNITYEIAKNNRVVVVHLPVDRITSLKSRNDPAIKNKLEVVKGTRDSLVKVNDNLWSYYPQIITESLNWIKIPSLFDLFNRTNSKRFAKEISKAVKLLGFKNFILINDNDFFRSFYLKEYLPLHTNIYYMRDFFTFMDYWKTHGTRLEPQLISKVDLALTNSTYLADYCRKYNKNSFYVGQGCDLSLFTNQNVVKLPMDLTSIPRPIIGYIGALVTVRLSVEILLHLAKNRSDWSIVLIGPEDEVFQKSELHKLSNVYFLGKKPIKEAPSYLHYFDVCINPQLVNPMTVGNYPLKIDEYLAMGKPVVATKTKTMEIFEKHVYLAETPEEYISKIEKALDEVDEELKVKRREFAASHTWENNVNEIYKSINLIEGNNH